MITVPNRLSQGTRELAARALAGEGGRALVDLRITLDGRDDLKGASAEMRYAAGVLAIAQQAPLRVLPEERIIGSATLQAAVGHKLPVYSEGELLFWSTSHTTLGFGRVLEEGYEGLRRRIEQRLARGGLDDKGVDLLRAMTVCLDAADIWHARHMDLLRQRIASSRGLQREHYQRVADNLAGVPAMPPRGFCQAIQSLWFAFAFQRLCGNWPGVGRIDKMLGPFLSRDLASGAITLEEARELLAHFWIKGCDWAGAGGTLGGGSGDAQFYQNIVLGGIDPQGQDVTNEVTYLVLDVVEELRISDFPIAVRLSQQSQPRLLEQIAQVQRLGGGIVAVYNEPQIIQSLVDFGYPLAEARDFANDGCWELLIPGKTCFGYVPYDVLLLLQETLGVTRPENLAPDFATFESLYGAFRGRLWNATQEIHRGIDGAMSGCPSTLASLLTDDCIERGRGYFDGGPRYTVRSPHAGGLADAGNSLLAIRKIVYEDRKLRLPELVDALRRDWDGQEHLRQYVVNRVELYGNDSPEADAMTRRVFDDFLAAAAAVRERNGVLRPPGVSTFGREIEWRRQRKAIAAGRHAGDILATNFSPSPGTDRKGATAVIKSHCSMGLSRLTNGTALELKMHPSSVEGPEGLKSLQALVQTFLKLGGIFMHIDAVDSAALRDAQERPEQYQGLAVRVSGWSARFVTLDRHWQGMIIGRTQQR